MTNRPVATVTFPFTDMEGSTWAREEYPVGTRAALKRHNEIVANEIEAHNGAMILERGEGDKCLRGFRADKACYT